MSIINDALKKAEKEKGARHLFFRRQKIDELPPAPEAKEQLAPGQQNIIPKEQPAAQKKLPRPIRFRHIISVVSFFMVISLLIIVALPRLLRQARIVIAPSKPQHIENAVAVLPPAPDPVPVALPVAQAEFTLSGIIHGSGSPMAVINGGVYMVGETVNDAAIVEISENEVVLERNGEIRLHVK